MEQLEALRAFVSRRSGIDWRDYSDRASFMCDYRRILRDGRDARVMLRYLEMAARNAAERGAPMPLPQGVNRMAWDGKTWEFTACQYHAMEYRAAACRWLAEAIAAHWDIPYRAGDDFNLGCRDAILRTARNAFGPGIAKRWFA
jgi:hypothetical protein